MKTVSVITAFYYGNKYIDQLLESIQLNYMQCIKDDIQVSSIIVNDSPDCKVNLREKEYDFAITLINNKVNVGIHASRVNGIAHSNSDYIIILDQDDILTDKAILNQIKLIENNDVCVGNGMRIEKDGGRWIFRSKRYQLMTGDVNVYIKYGTPIISPGQCLIKKDAISSVWLNNIIKRNGADDEILWLLMLLEGKKFCVNFKDVYHHIATGHNASDDYGAMAISSLEGVRLLDEQALITKSQRNNFIRRRKMKKERHNASIIKKIFVNLKYLDLSLYVIYIKMIEKVGDL